MEKKKEYIELEELYAKAKKESRALEFTNLKPEHQDFIINELQKNKVKLTRDAQKEGGMR